MKKIQIAGYLFTALLLCGFDQATAQQTSKKNSSKNNIPQIGMAPRCCDQGNFDVNFDFLWWTTNFNATTGLHVALEEPRVRVAYKHPSSSWDPGVRLSMGWNTGYDNWDVQGMWTYFFGSSGGHKPNKFRFRYNAADLELGKAFYVSPHFFIRPFTGAHAIWTSVRTTSLLPIAGILDSALAPATIDPYNYLTNIDVGAWGIGPRIGVNTGWGNFEGFSLVANISSSLVYGKHLDKAHATVGESTGADLFASFRDKEFWELMPTMQIQFGPSFLFCFNDGANQFHMSALWETNIIWNAANHLDADKSISMNGLTIDFGFAF